MTRRLLSRAAGLMGLLCAASACDGLTDINENPNAPTDVPADVLLAQSIQSAVRLTFGGDLDSRLMLHHTAIWSQHVVQLQYPLEETGQVFGVDAGTIWDAYYTGPLADIRQVIDKSVESGDAGLEAVGRIWQAWIFHIVTDLWGDVPYSEALQGADNTTPIYDRQAAIYASLLEELTRAEAALGQANSIVVQGDLLYGGDVGAWRRFANSLRMRLAMRLSEIDPATAEAEFAAAYSAGGFRSNADNAMLEYPGGNYENPLYVDYLSRDDNGVSATMIDTLLSLNDPRLPLYAEPAAFDGAYRGHHNGHIDLPDDLPEGAGLNFFSRIGNFWRADGARTPAAVMTYGEVLFLQAEAAARGWIAEQPEALYTAGIRASMDLYDEYGVGPSDAEVAAYLAQPRVVYDPANGLNQIYLQKWIALWMNGSEAWAEWRRTDVPNLMPGPDLVVSRIPIRLRYPDLEQSLNGDNLAAAVARQGGGLDLVTPVWWDVR